MVQPLQAAQIPGQSRIGGQSAELRSQRLPLRPRAQFGSAPAPARQGARPGVLDAAAALRDRLTALELRVKMDDSEQSPGWKYAQYEMKGVPLRVEIGPKDMEKQQCCMARRDTGEKTFVPLSDLESAAQTLLQDVHDNLYAMAEKNLEDNTFDFTTWEEVKEMAQGKGGFARTKWCGSLECELAMKEKAGVSSRCMPLKQSGTTGKCVVCGKACTTDIYWGVAY